MSDSVTIVRPAQPVRAAVPAESEIAALAQPKAPARVMVIDDSPDVVSVLSRFLKNEGCVALEAHSGIEGLSLLADNDVDLIFLDLMMPEMNGFEVLQAIKSGQRNAEVPVIMMTARNDREARIQAERLGIEDFLSKPVFRNQLSQKLKSQLHPGPVEHGAAEEHRSSLGSYVSFRNDLHDRVWSENWSNRFMRPGLLLIALFELVSIASVAVLNPEVALRQLSFEEINILAAAAFGCVAFMYSSRFASHWHGAAIAFALVILMAASLLSVATGQTEPLLIAIILLLLGAGALVPWNFGWQLALTIVCLVWFSTATRWLPAAKPDGIDKWLALLAAAGLAQVGIARNEYQRRQFESRIVFAEGTPES